MPLSQKTASDSSTKTSGDVRDRVIPDVRVRQWVLSPPLALRYRVAHNFPLLAALMRILIRAIFSSLRRLGRESGISRGRQFG